MAQPKCYIQLSPEERISIIERPEAVQHRKQAGQWESDTVIARTSRSVLLATVERKSRYTKLAKLARRTAKQVRISLNRSFSRYPKKLRRPITYDNGQENVEYDTVNKTLGTRSYFCQPYHSWEKGTVENTIGIIRRTFPPKTNRDDGNPSTQVGNFFRESKRKPHMMTVWGIQRRAAHDLFY